MIYNKKMSKLVVILLIIVILFMLRPTIAHAKGVFSDLNSTKTPQENFDSMLNQTDADKERALKEVAEKLKKFILIMKDMILDGIKAFLYFAKFVFNRQFFIGLINLLKDAINAIVQVIKDILLI